ncbi:hypothetical protein VWY06_02010 [Phaeobacter sp. JH20_10]|uniref:hypothetical protein n=1 Tax=Phaeobacter sp. JH20_10 TaxID=3112469 RepID=UPI003A88BF0E
MKALKHKLVVFFAYIIASSTALAEPILTKTLPTGADDIIDYRIDGCKGLAGFGRLNYSSGRTVLTDFCLDEETGAFISSEPLNGLELTAKSRNGRKFEDLSSGTSQYQRNSVTILPDENIPGCTPEPIESVHASVQSPQSKDFAGEDFGHFIGYTYPTSSPLPAAASAEIYFGLRSVTPDPSSPASFRTGGIENAQGDMLANAIFDEMTGKVTVTGGGGYTYGDASGAFEINFIGDGAFTMIGKFEAKSLRLKGHEPSEMVSTSGEIAHFRGHVVGSDGSGLLGYGIVEGAVKDAAGKVHRYQALAYLLSCIEAP